MTLRKQIYSGICMCGHEANDHHGSMILNPDAAKIMGSRFADECLYYGFNEDGGLDENGVSHCHRYVDNEDPDIDRRNKWGGTVREYDRKVECKPLEETKDD